MGVFQWHQFVSNLCGRVCSSISLKAICMGVFAVASVCKQFVYVYLQRYQFVRICVGVFAAISVCEQFAWVCLQWHQFKSSLCGCVCSGAFVCTLCEEGLVLEGSEDGASEVTGKRKAPLGLSDKDLKVCERILLELFCHPSSIPFHEPVNRAVSSLCLSVCVICIPLHEPID